MYIYSVEVVAGSTKTQFKIDMKGKVHMVN